MLEVERRVEIYAIYLEIVRVEAGREE